MAARIVRGRGGFMLVEVLVAVVVGGLFLGVLGRVLAGAWGASRTPMDVLSAVTLARAQLQQDRRDAGSAGLPGYVVTRSSIGVEISARPSHLAPAPLSTAAAPAPPERGPAPALKHISIVVRTPSGRSVTFDTVRFDAAPP